MATRSLATAHPTLRARYKAALRLYKKRKWAQKYRIQISCVRRTNEEQMALYARGRSKPGSIVTYCDGVINKSKHQPDGHGFSRAIDVFVIKRSTGKAVWRWNPALWLFIMLADEVGLECGRFWKWKDSFHIQMYDHDR